jgi:ATP-binding cassette, subfamily A (ABC1), member 3
VYGTLIFLAAILFFIHSEFGTYVNIVASSFGHMSVLYLFVCIFLFAMNVVGFSQVVSALFSDSKTASQLGTTFILFPTAIAMMFAIQTTLPLGHRQEA